MKHVSANNLIPEEQFGFMPGCSTTLQLPRLMEYITSGFERRWSTIAVFLDINKAYDSTWHSGLIYKFIQLKVPFTLITIIDSYLAQRSFRVKMEGAFSEQRDPCWQDFHRGLYYWRFVQMTFVFMIRAKNPYSYIVQFRII